jgi:hypothetical protein
VAAFEVPLAVAALGEEAAQRGVRATALLLLLGGSVLAAQIFRVLHGAI